MPKSASNKRHFIIVGVLVVITTVVMGIILNGVLPLPLAAATQAATVDWLFVVHMWLIAFLFALGHGLYGLFACRLPAEQAANGR